MKTKKVKFPVTGPGVQAQVRFNEKANSDKVSETGFDFFSANGLLGELNTAPIAVAPNRPIYVFNDTATIEFVALSQDSAMIAPVGAATGIPIAPFSGMLLASGNNTFIRASAVTVFGYHADDNIVENG